ncbi:T-complex protein 11-domain-containing protein [Lobosporangium transversale]|uniref:T-complex protein 11-domain-containing protein n=1 Tax=Lobosporangium transversale TaxID=64571 RepID=A0A1Y2G7I0_9FUNG|nr:T-complex protein 11-domain-containing protein [Lobosporangium transversale]ORZ00010.1 T-complex protein 11-domain-containing protein [Lobosporangium transversale]|eukprot:XP_021876051.1 T-complex protein 11-domain-containing protein [Lobosporangium transversale]
MLEIFKNPQLRHDIVFDPHLQFRPNFDGERGLVKRREADRFWREVGIELNNRRATLAARREASNTMLSLAGLPSSSSASRLVQQQAQQLCPLPKAVLLPRLIDELREILISLLPPTPPAPATSPDGKPDPPPINPERVQLMSTLDPDLIIQELDHGVLDVHALFRFLGDCLKGHCAPMRDALVESMVNIVVDFDEIVRGIRMCFEILEWMKLDIANHQLRTLRPWLLNNSVDFEQKYFADLLTRGGSFERTISWFKRAWIQWESVKRTVIGPQVTNNETSAQSNLDSRRSSLATSTTVTMIFDTDHGNTGQEPNTVSSSASTILDDKRRSAIIRADIGENILDGVVNEGLLEMILRPHRATKTMPETFEFDHYRLLSFHNDFQDLTILCILLILFRQLAQNAWTQQDLVEIKKVVWLLLTDENANFGANTNPGPGAPAAAATGDSDKSSPSASSSGMKDIVIQIEFAARKVRERNKSTTTPSTVTAGSGVARPSQSVGVPTLIGVQRRNSLSLGAVADAKNDKIASSTLSVPLSSLAMSSSLTPSPSASSSTLTSGLSGNDTNLLAAWLDNALTKTSMLYQLIQKRLLIHFRRWLYLHSCSSMMVLSASCATLASAMSMSKATGSRDTMKTVEEDEEDENGMDVGKSSSNDSVKDQENKNGDGDCQSAGAVVKNQSSEASSQSGTASTLTASTLEPASAQAPAPSQDAAPGMSAEEANKAAAEALAAKLSFNTVEMEAHGLTGLEDEMIALLEKIRAVAEFNKKVYGSWYRDLVMQGRAENWLEKDIRV